jgi:hypothetical protein
MKLMKLALLWSLGLSSLAIADVKVETHLLNVNKIFKKNPNNPLQESNLLRIRQLMNANGIQNQKLQIVGVRVLGRKLNPGQKKPAMRLHVNNYVSAPVMVRNRNQDKWLPLTQGLIGKGPLLKSPEPPVQIKKNFKSQGAWYLSFTGGRTLIRQIEVRTKKWVKPKAPKKKNKIDVVIPLNITWDSGKGLKEVKLPQAIRNRTNLKNFDASKWRLNNMEIVGRKVKQRHAYVIVQVDGQTLQNQYIRKNMTPMNEYFAFAPTDAGAQTHEYYNIIPKNKNGVRFNKHLRLMHRDLSNWVLKIGGTLRVVKVKVSLERWKKQ